MMDPEQRARIQHNYVRMVHDLDITDGFLIYFVPERVLTEDNIEEIMVNL
mgnify:CR=1 FL=1